MLNHDEMNEALVSLKSYCDSKMSPYTLISVRHSLRTLGYHNGDLDQLMQAIYDHGFRYCFDPQFKCSDGIPGSDKQVYPTSDVCYWGPDQLKSRLPMSFWQGYNPDIP
jgi:hypothetical protein